MEISPNHASLGEENGGVEIHIRQVVPLQELAIDGQHTSVTFHV